MKELYCINLNLKSRLITGWTYYIIMSFILIYHPSLFNLIIGHHSITDNIFSFQSCLLRFHYGRFSLIYNRFIYHFNLMNYHFLSMYVLFQNLIISKFICDALCHLYYISSTLEKDKEESDWKLDFLFISSYAIYTLRLLHKLCTLLYHSQESCILYDVSLFLPQALNEQNMYLICVPWHFVLYITRRTPRASQGVSVVFVVY